MLLSELSYAACQRQFDLNEFCLAGGELQKLLGVTDTPTRILEFSSLVCLHHSFPVLLDRTAQTLPRHLEHVLGCSPALF